MAEGRNGRPVIERDVVRLVVLDANEHILLLHTRDLGSSTSGTAWELPGGGMEPGETYVEAAIRELHEETGIRITPGCIDRPTWRRDVSYSYRGARRLQHEIIVAVHLNRAAPPVESTHRVEFESDDLIGYRWWSVPEIVASNERFYPRRLPRLLPGFLAGVTIDEPFEFWS